LEFEFGKKSKENKKKKGKIVAWARSALFGPQENSYASPAFSPPHVPTGGPPLLSAASSTSARPTYFNRVSTAVTDGSGPRVRDLISRDCHCSAGPTRHTQQRQGRRLQAAITARRRMQASGLRRLAHRGGDLGLPGACGRVVVAALGGGGGFAVDIG
jgi:hypothetical protein